MDAAVGLGTGDAEAIRRLSEQVEITPIAADDSSVVSLDELATKVEVDPA